ncbi:hypothetical protein [Paractinoplanes brasiliensis]|uniref:Abortive infection protein n=1 Tax=Paractinoplanes brasiliensis TaxID=52695 RepID=A0A4R6JEB3_9ACTN|nr:hypothetical protein [Actinoplanes brasiliensis]TDO32895.1 hypothetical protein C8E87_8372 [Actinoplanes brasiliensis]GID28611.1 hypothetical protein Abr02nite_35940 [Actinoplanes brasiliensis]
MRAKGITYDTGFAPGGRSSRPGFDPGAVKQEMRIIADDLHCDAVRITGGDPERLSVAAGHAADAGLEVWFSPFPCEQTAQELLPYFADCADRAEAAGAAVFVAGCELSLFDAGFLPGADTFARINSLSGGDPEAVGRLGDASAAVNRLLADAAATVRRRFRGRITYASGTWEDIDWTPFDIVGVDAYVDPDDPGFRPAVQQFLRPGKPLAVTEFGCCTYRGAAARGGMGWDIVDYDADPPRIPGDVVRDEEEPARYLRRLIAAFDREGVDTAFWFTFASYSNPYHPDPHLDLDMAGFGVCKVMPDGHLEPKRAFRTMAGLYRK